MKPVHRFRAPFRLILVGHFMERIENIRVLILMSSISGLWGHKLKTYNVPGDGVHIFDGRNYSF
jgi:hypothetical protein